MSNLSMLRETTGDNTLPAFAWPGGYPMYYFAKDGTAFCVDCANQADAEPPIYGGDVNWEDGALMCEGCGTIIPPAYDPEEDEEEIDAEAGE